MEALGGKPEELGRLDESHLSEIESAAPVVQVGPDIDVHREEGNLGAVLMVQERHTTPTTYGDDRVGVLRNELPIGSACAGPLLDILDGSGRVP